jgi:hypothetical protein
MIVGEYIQSRIDMLGDSVFKVKKKFIQFSDSEEEDSIIGDVFCK